MTEPIKQDRDPKTNLVREKIRERIKTLYEAKGLSQSEFGRLLGLNRQAISKWVKVGDQVPNEANMVAIAKLLETSISYLYGETDYPGPPAQWSVPTSELSARTEEARRRLLEVVELLGKQGLIEDIARNSKGNLMTEAALAEKLAEKQNLKALGE